MRRSAEGQGLKLRSAAITHAHNYAYAAFSANGIDRRSSSAAQLHAGTIKQWCIICGVANILYFLYMMLYLRRHLVKLITFGSLCVGLTLYFQLDTSNQDTYLIAARQPLASKHTKNEAKYFYEAWEMDMQNKLQGDDQDPEKNVRVYGDHEPVIDGPIKGGMSR